MALTVRPDDEVYQFDTVWLGPDEYTLPIQARYVAWGTWLACFLVAAAILVPLGGNGPGGVLGSLVWALALSVVLSRAVMLVVDHERPLRSLPALFSAEARAAVAARRRAERSLLVRPDRVRVRPTPAKVLAIRERQRRRAERRAARRGTSVPPATELAPVETAEALGPDWREPGSQRAEWAPDLSPAASGLEDWDQPTPAPAWSVPTDEPHDRSETRHPVVPVLDRHAAPSTPAPAADRTAPSGPAAPAARPAAFRPHSTDQPAAQPAATARRADHPEAAEGDPGPVTVTPHGGRHGRTPAGRNERPHRGRQEQHDRQAAVEARILLPARKDR